MHNLQDELLEVVNVMKREHASYTKLKVKMPSGVLLCGPPGTGKTLLGEWHLKPARWVVCKALLREWHS